MKRSEALQIIFETLYASENLDLPYTGSSNFEKLSDEILSALESAGMLPPHYKVIPEPSGWEIAKGTEAYKNEWELEDEES